jgi:hypothetical protein
MQYLLVWLYPWRNRENNAVVFALIFTKPASGKAGVATTPPPPLHNTQSLLPVVTIDAKTTVHCFEEGEGDRHLVMLQKHATTVFNPSETKCSRY